MIAPRALTMLLLVLVYMLAVVHAGPPNYDAMNLEELRAEHGRVQLELAQNGQEAERQKLHRLELLIAEAERRRQQEDNEEARRQQEDNEARRRQEEDEQERRRKQDNEERKKKKTSGLRVFNKPPPELKSFVEAFQEIPEGTPTEEDVVRAFNENVKEEDRTSMLVAIVSQVPKAELENLLRPTTINLSEAIGKLLGE